MLHPTREMFDAWFDAYGMVSQVYVDGMCFTIRPLTRGEYKRARGRAGNNSAILAEETALAGCLWPQDYDFRDEAQKASTPIRVANEIISISGFTQNSAQELFLKWRDKVFENEERWDLLIMLVFPYVTYKELDMMTSDEYFHYLAAAEFRMRTQIKITMNEEYFNPEEFVDALIVDESSLRERFEQFEAERAQADAENGAIPTVPGMPPGTLPPGYIPPGIPPEGMPQQHQPSPEREARLNFLKNQTAQRGPYGRR